MKKVIGLVVAHARASTFKKDNFRDSYLVPFAAATTEFEGMFFSRR